MRIQRADPQSSESGVPAREAPARGAQPPKTSPPTPKFIMKNIPSGTKRGGATVGIDAPPLPATHAFQAFRDAGCEMGRDQDFGEDDVEFLRS